MYTKTDSKILLENKMSIVHTFMFKIYCSIKLRKNIFEDISSLWMMYVSNFLWWINDEGF